jgi:hypothetical protein
VTRPLLFAPIFAPDHARPGVGFSVVLLHIGLLWVANIYWPLQMAAQDAREVAVQIFRIDTRPDAKAAAGPSATNSRARPDTAVARNPRSITTQRLGRAETQLDLPRPQETAQLAAPLAVQQSTPLAGTRQVVNQKKLLTPDVAVAPTVPAVATVSVAPIAPSQAIAPATVPVTATAPAPPTSAPAVAERAPVLKAAEPSTSTSPTPQTPPSPRLPQTMPDAVVALPAASTPSLPLPSALATPPALAVPTLANAMPTAGTATVASPSAATNANVNPSPNGSANATGVAAGATPGLQGAQGVQGDQGVQGTRDGPSGQSSNLNLGVPRLPYRPPLALPRRSLAEQANEQLRRKPRDPFADAVEGAGNIDCLRETPEGPAQGLLAIGPLLKRAIDEKCKK